MLLRYLMVNRLRPSIASYQWFKVWGKRFFTFPSLLSLGWSCWNWRRRGVVMGTMASMGECEIQGNHQRLIIGDFSYVGRATIQLMDSVNIGRNVIINDKVTILTGSHDANDEHFQLQTKPVIIYDYAWICTGAMILPGVIVGKGSVVAAGAVVSKDVPAYHVVAGNPAKVVRNNRNPKLNYKPNLLRACFEAWVGVPYKKNEQ